MLPKRFISSETAATSNAKRTCMTTGDTDKSSSISSKKHLSLESLPTAILDSIFELVASRDLVNVCQVSKSLYLPAVSRLYKTITISGDHYLYLRNRDESDTDDEHYRPHYNDHYKPTNHRKYWKVNYGTILRMEKVRLLVKALRNNKTLGPLVQKINFEVFDMRCTELLSLIPNIVSYHEQGGFWQLTDVKGFFQTITCTTLHPPQLNCNLVELRIVDFSKECDGPSYRYIALDLVASNAYKTLRRLQFSPCRSTIHRQKPLGPHPPADFKPYWLEFLYELSRRKVKLNLTSLGIHALLPKNVVPTFMKAKPGIPVIDLIKSTVELKELKELVLHHSEKPGHLEPKCSFLETITQFTPLLEILAIHPTAEEETSDIEAICRTLQVNLPHRLKDLFILYFISDDLELRQSLQKAILSSQSNLVRLKLQDEKPMEPDYPDINMPTMLGDMESAWLAELERQRNFPEIMDTFHRRPFLRRFHVARIKSHVEALKAVFEEDLVYSGVSALPHLRQYYLGGHYVDMKRRGIFANGETILFSDEATTEN